MESVELLDPAVLFVKALLLVRTMLKGGKRKIIYMAIESEMPRDRGSGMHLNTAKVFKNSRAQRTGGLAYIHQFTICTS